MVAPDLQGRGIGRVLLEAIEAAAADEATGYVLFTGALSERNIRMYKKAGYRLLGPAPEAPGAVRLAKRQPLARFRRTAGPCGKIAPWPSSRGHLPQGDDRPAPMLRATTDVHHHPWVTCGSHEETPCRIIDDLSSQTKRDDVPDFRAGDTVKVHVKVVEGNRSRIQVFQGVVLKLQGSGVGRTFTVRKVSFGVGVERTFPLHSPIFEKIEIVTRGDVRRAKLYYLRNLRGKAAKIKERREG